MTARPLHSLPYISARYQATRHHARGRYTTVFEGIDRAVGRPVAIKVLTDSPAHLRMQLVQRMHNEAQVLTRHSHPNILRCYHNGAAEDPPHLIVEWIQGGSLLGHLEQSSKPLAPVRALSIGLMLLDVLQVLHEADIIHRDIKPANILLRGDRAVLCDFGIAQMQTQERLTMADSSMGSMNFMAPEQRVDARSVGPAADLYAVGCTLYQALTGWNTYNLFMTRRNSPRWDALSPAVADVLFKATRANPEERYDSSAQMACAIQAVLETSASTPVESNINLSMLDSPDTLPIDEDVGD